MIIKFKKHSKKSYKGFFTKALNTYLEQKSKRTYKRKRVIRPSEIGYCIRKQVMGILNILPEEVIKPRIQRIFDNGNSVHSRYLNTYLKHIQCKPVEREMEKDGKKEWVECVEQTFRDEELWLKGAPDAIIHNAEDDLTYIFELKSIKQEQFTTLARPIQEHITQVHVYMYMTGIKQSVIVYENKNTQDIKEFSIDFDQTIMDELLNKIHEIQRYVTDYETTKELPAKCHERYCGACKDK